MDADEGRLWVCKDKKEDRNNEGREEKRESKVRKSHTESRSSQASHQTYIG